MKRVLLATTALVAAGAFAGVAQADDTMGPIKVGISGYTQAAMGFYSGDLDTNDDKKDDRRGHDIGYVYEFALSGSTTLDNGITVGVHAQIGRSGDPFDEQYISMGGAFGSFRIGETESAAFNSTVPAPGGGVALGVNYVWFGGAAPTVNTWVGIGMEDALKVVYTSPNFNGLTIGLSYAPDDTEKLGGDRALTAGTIGGHTAVGMNYSTEFMEGGSLTLGAGYEMASAEVGNEDPSATRFGINIGFDQIVVGGSMYDYDDGTKDSKDSMQYDVGAGWSDGPLGIGIQYAHNEDGDTAMTAGHVNYTLGPGVAVGVQIATGSGKENKDGDKIHDVTQFMLGTSISF